MPFIVKSRCHRRLRTTAALKSEPWADGEIAIETGPVHFIGLGLTMLHPGTNCWVVTQSYPMWTIGATADHRSSVLKITGVRLLHHDAFAAIVSEYWADLLE